MDQNKARQIASRFLYVQKVFRAKKELSFSYMLYRFFRPILKVYTKLLRTRYKPHPWTTPGSIEIFDSLFTKDMKGLEYGSGGSTVFFAQRLGQLVSVDHHKGWYEKVSDLLKEKGLENVEYHLIEKNTTEDAPSDKASTLDNFNFDKSIQIKWWYYKYFDFVNQFDDNHFDFILIDGRARVECLVNSIPKLKSGGMLVLDNSERLRYAPVFKLLLNWNRVDTTNGLTDTTIWFKP